MLCRFISTPSDEARDFVSRALDLAFDGPTPVPGLWRVAPRAALVDLTVTVSAGDDALWGGPVVVAFSE